MKQIFFYALLSVGSLFLSSCIWGSGDKTDSLLIAKSALDLKEKKKRESDGVNRGDCKDDDDCEDVCEDVYNEDDDEENEGNVDRCLDLTYKTAITFKRILEILEEPYYADLLNIEARDFEKFLDVSVGPWVEKTKRINNTEAKNLLKWIASESKVSSAIKSAYSDKKEDFDLYEGTRWLFAEIAPKLTKYKGSSKAARATRRCAEFCSAVNKSTLAQSQSFWEMTSDNSDGRDIACKILEVQCKDATIDNVKATECPDAVKTACSLSAGA